MEQLAERVHDALREEFGESCLVGVSYYDHDEIGHVYRSEWAAEKYEPEQVDAIVEDLRLEALAHGAQEQRQMERLRATTRIYEELLDIVVPVSDVQGVAIALEIDAEYRVRDVIDTVERVVASADVDADVDIDEDVGGDA